MYHRDSFGLQRVLMGLSAALAFGLAVAASSPDPMHADHMAGHAGHGDGMDHSQHMAMMETPGYRRSEARYTVPDVVLLDQRGEAVGLRDLLQDPQPVMLNFIFTTCTTICPVLSASFTQAQKLLGPDAEKVRMVSVTIDPEHDTPERLAAYARRFRAEEGWLFLTGRRGDVVTLQKAFDAYRGDKMSHIPLIFVRGAPGDQWIRLEGFPNAEELVGEYRAMTPVGIATVSE